MTTHVCEYLEYRGWRAELAFEGQEEAQRWVLRNGDGDIDNQCLLFCPCCGRDFRADCWWQIPGRPQENEILREARNLAGTTTAWILFRENSATPTAYSNVPVITSPGPLPGVISVYANWDTVIEDMRLIVEDYRNKTLDQGNWDGGDTRGDEAEWRSSRVVFWLQEWTLGEYTEHVPEVKDTVAPTAWERLRG